MSVLGLLVQGVLVVVALALGLTLIGLSLFQVPPNPRVMYYMWKIANKYGYSILQPTLELLTIQLSDTMDYLEKFTARSPRLCPVFIGYLGNIIMTEAEDIQELFSSTVNIRKGYEYETIIPWLQEGLLTSSGAKWHARRKMLTPTFHFKILEEAARKINHKSKVFGESLANHIGEEVDVHEEITKHTLDVIIEMAMGIKLADQDDGGKKYTHAVKGLLESATERVVTVSQHSPLLFPFTANGKEYFSFVKTMHNFSQKIINNRKENFSANSLENQVSGKVRRAFLDCLLEIEANNPGSLTNSDIREEVDTFMFEGHDTTSSALLFCLFILGTYPQVQERVYEEVMEVMGGDKDKNLCLKEVSSLSYMEKVIKETLRLFPSVPYMSRRLNQDCVLKDGVILPSGANVILVTYISHRNEKYFPNPEEFDPERFSDEQVLNRHPFAYLPFSAGPRNCIGQKFAMLEIKLTLAHILTQLKIETVTKREEFKVLPHFILRPTVPIKCKFYKR